MRLEEPNIEPIEETEWVACSKVCDFLKGAAKVAEAESSTSYVTSSMAKKGFDQLLRVFGKKSTSSSSAFKDVAKRMLAKLQKYSALVHSLIANIARILDLRFLTDIIRDRDILRSFIPVILIEDFDRLIGV